MEQAPSSVDLTKKPVDRRTVLLALASTVVAGISAAIHNTHTLAAEKEPEPTDLWSEPDGEIPLGDVHTIKLETGEGKGKKERTIKIHYSKDGTTLFLDEEQVTIEVFGTTTLAFKVEKRTEDDQPSLQIEGGFDKQLTATATFSKTSLAKACNELLAGKSVDIDITSGAMKFAGKMIPKKKGGK